MLSVLSFKSSVYLPHKLEDIAGKQSALVRSEVRGTRPCIVAQSAIMPTVSQFVALPSVSKKSQHMSSATVPAIGSFVAYFLFPILHPESSVTYPIRTLRREFYHGTPARNTLNGCKSQVGAIIFLFGTLSVHEPPCYLMSPSHRQWA